MRFRTRLILQFSFILLVAGLLTTIAVLSTAREQRLAAAQSRLETGQRVLQEALRARAETLSSAVSALTADFGFKQAVATGERETMTTMLFNHSGRVDADLAAVISLDGSVLATTDEALGDTFRFPALLTSGDDMTARADVVVVGGRVYQLVVSPVFLPQQVGWASIGFEINQSLVAGLSTLTGLEVAITGAASGPSGDDLYVASSMVAAKSFLEGGTESQWLTAGSPLTSNDSAAITALVQLSIETVMHDYRILRDRLLSIFMLSLAGSVVVCLLIARRVSQPLSALMRFANRLRRGDYSAEVSVAGTDEFGVLAGTLDEMREGIAEREARITHQLRHDALTGLFNGEGVRLQMQARIDEHASFAVLRMRLDGFDELVEALGEEFGDRVLARTVQRLAALITKEQVLGRIGTRDLVIVSGEVSRSALSDYVDALRNAINKPMSIDGVIATLSLATGISICPNDGETTDQIARRAAIALSHARPDNGRLAFYTDGQEQIKRRRLTMVHDLKTAISERQLFLVYQPKIDTATRRCYSVEALVRWEHPRIGFVPPDEFIGVAEKAGLIGHLTRWLIGEAAAQAARWKQQGHDLRIAINLSALDLMNPGLPEMCLKALRRHGLQPDALTLEITESAAIADTSTALATLDALGSAGFALAIDDFGTGQSSMAQLASLPVTELKIDRSFVQAMEQDQKSLNIVKSMVSLAKSMDLKIVAEGVETLTAWQALEQLKCEELQGYFFSKPVSAQALTEWIDHTLPRFATEIQESTLTARIANVL